MQLGHQKGLKVPSNGPKKKRCCKGMGEWKKFVAGVKDKNRLDDAWGLEGKGDGVHLGHEEGTQG